MAPSVQQTSTYSSATTAPQILALNGILMGVALLVVSLRLYARLLVLKSRLGWDDYVILAAMACSIATFICYILETQSGLGRHFVDITKPELEHFFLIEYYKSFFVMAGTGLAKISVGLFLLRFVAHPFFKRFIIGMIVFLVISTIACGLTLVFRCNPPSQSWNIPAGNRNCSSRHTFVSLGLFYSSINIATDFIFASLPVPIIWGLTINKRTKVAMIFILSMGFFVCIISIYKTYLQSRIFEVNDFTFNDPYYKWATVELNVSIVAASLPTLRSLFVSCLERTIPAIRGLNSPKGSGASGHKTPNRPGSIIAMNTVPAGKEESWNTDTTCASKTVATDHASDGYTNNNDSQENILPMTREDGSPTASSSSMRVIEFKNAHGATWEEV